MPKQPWDARERSDYDQFMAWVDQAHAKLHGPGGWTGGPEIWLDDQILAPGTYWAEPVLEGGRIKVTLADGRWGWVAEEGSILQGSGRFVLTLVG